MQHLKMHSLNKIDENVSKIAQLFPNCVTEAKDENGEITHKIDFDMLKQELSTSIVEGREERYQFTWPDKKQAILTANAPINKTLRPCREESVNFDETENLYIEGDNFDILKVLQETYLNSINVIYIDPPYNTGNDILYSNDYSDKEDEFGAKYEVDENGMKMYVNTDSNGRYHTNWLNMMYPRIKVAKDLLKEEGFFLIAIDHNELINIGEICDEIFGYSNRVGIISVVHKPEGRNQAKFIGPSNEFMLIYAKNEQVAKLQKVVLDEEQQKAFSCSDEKGAYRLKNFIRLADGKYATKEAKPNFWYPIYVSPDCTELSIQEKDNYVPVYPITETGVERTWKTTKDTFWERYKAGDIVAKKEIEKIIIYEKLREDQVIKTHWIEKKYHGYHFGTKLLDDLHKQNLFQDNVKPDRTAEDLLFQVMLDLGVELSSKITTKEMNGKIIYYVNENYLVACFEQDITEEIITQIAKEKPYYFVMKDSGFANDSVATNFEQIFTTYSAETVRKVI